MGNYQYSLLCPYCGEIKNLEGEEGDAFSITVKGKRKRNVFPPYSKVSGNCSKCKKPLSFLPEYYAYQELDGATKDDKMPALSSPSKTEQVAAFVSDCSKQIEKSIKSTATEKKELSFDETKEYLLLSWRRFCTTGENIINWHNINVSQLYVDKNDPRVAENVIQESDSMVS